MQTHADQEFRESAHKKFGADRSSIFWSRLSRKRWKLTPDIINSQIRSMSRGCTSPAEEVNTIE